ncbi:TonB-dependent receptor plug domain-containing protein [Telluribacter sp. SYSU D00476]|uniref:TonB-dependent receptor n=1 Tax=Telluribacter sp. SYSU D00476 TaxID=2811430 RepID=UPI001FF51F0D|nr:TonB-dependent receptor plug domain-containing protein [Telluribacter sp. SYSU D00476]
MSSPSRTVPLNILVICVLLANSFFLPCTLYAQNVTVSGYVLNNTSGEAAAFGTIYLNSIPKAKTNAFGYFTFSTTPGHHTLTAQAPGLLSCTLNLTVSRDTTLTIELAPWEMQLDEVKVTSPLIDEKGNYRLTPQQIKSVPTVLSEPDVLKVLQLLPGVQGGTEGTAGVHVRGGSPDQTLILMDGVPVYNVNHLFGFFSVFNPDAVASVDLYKNELPARYGGRLASVIDLTMREGNRREYKKSFQLSPISSKVLFEGPIKIDTASYLVSIRKTWLDVLGMAAQRLAGFNTASQIGFYDINAKLNYQPNQRNRFFLSLYTGNDGFSSASSTGSTKSNYGFKWGNSTAIARWNHLFGPNLFKNSTLSVTNYRFFVQTRYKSPESAYRFRTSSRITDLTYKSDFVYTLPQSEVQFGTEATMHRFAPEIVQVKDDLEAEQAGRSAPPATWVADTRLYADYVYRPSKALRLQGGLHYNFLRVAARSYHGLQPRLSLNAELLPSALGLRASYVQTMQFLHLLTNSSLGLPTDMWVPITDQIPPQRGRQYSAGVYGSIKSSWHWSLDLYTKSMRNLLEYTEGATFLNNPDLRWYDWVTVGDGASRGLEVLLQKSGARFSGFASYTLSKTTRTFERLNAGQTFPYRYDRRHVLNLSAQYTFNKRRSIQGLFTVNSGGYVTIATQRYGGAPLPIFYEGEPIPMKYQDPIELLGYFPERNNLEMPSYHRMDVSYKTSREKKKGLRTWTFSVYNAYNQRNAFFLFVNDNRLKKYTLFPLLPSVSYEFRFK